MDDRGGLRGGGTPAHGPRADFLHASSEVGLQAEQAVGRVDHAVQARLAQAEVGQEGVAVFVPAVDRNPHGAVFGVGDDDGARGLADQRFGLGHHGFQLRHCKRRAGAQRFDFALHLGQVQVVRRWRSRCRGTRS
ncbi:hypothetical protein G6F63_015436 [Rhizopus arrhizus]|nr:hypothetical protein G6F63_015436 [Rhizopus arrhizus]